MKRSFMAGEETDCVTEGTEAEEGTEKTEWPQEAQNAQEGRNRFLLRLMCLLWRFSTLGRCVFVAKNEMDLDVRCRRHALSGWKPMRRP